MKKIIVILLIVSMILPTLIYADDNAVTVSIPNYKVTINGIVLDNSKRDYPVLSYRNVSYIPMTYDVVKATGLSLDFDSKGVYINKSNNGSVLRQSMLGGNYRLGSTTKASIPDFVVKVNGNTIDNKTADYPIIHYKNITYFPIIWEYTIKEFNWTTTWSSKEGLKIYTTAFKPKEAEKVDESKLTGVENISQTLDINGKKISFSGYKVDLNDEQLEVKTALAYKTIGETQTLKDMAIDNKAVLAINGGYFNAYLKGEGAKDPYGILIVDGELTHNGNDRGTIAFKDNKVDIDRTNVRISGKSFTGSRTLSWYAYWMNHTTDENSITFTIFDKNRGETTNNFFGTNFVVEDDVVTKVTKNMEMYIPENGYVVNLNGQLGNNMTQVYDCFVEGYDVNFDYELTPSNIDEKAFWNDLDYATGAGPALILEGKKDIDFAGEYFYEPKILTNTAARSAIGYTKDNELIMITTTATVYELADIMLALGCYEAINLDGGASSGLWFNGKYDREPGRDISNMIYITVK